MINDSQITQILSQIRRQNASAIDRLIERVIELAIEMRVSDIHIEPYEADSVIRFRIDGVLLEIARFEPSIFAPLVSKIKILANMDIAEKRKPQDGRMSVSKAQKELDCRVSTLPTICGESVAIRLLDKSAVLLDIESLGISSANALRLKNMLKNPHGIVLVTGATGSGKTTTLYAVLNLLKSSEKKIITVEDPVEYKINNIQQLQTNEKAGLDFTNALRSILRQDPDVIMIGEIRDEETLKIAIQASLTGHLVLSTLHTNTAISALARLVDMGAKSYLLADSLRCVIAQRLVRRLCECKTKIALSSIPQELSSHFQTGDTIYRANGCHKCAGTGYFGREMICEILNITNELASMIALRVEADELTKRARADGFITMLEDGVESVKNGCTSAEELMRVVWFETL